MSDHSDYPVDMGRLVRKLNYYESIIEKLLERKNLHSIASLEKKIIALEEMILQIPIDDDEDEDEPNANQELVDEWRDSVVSLWERLFDLVALASAATSSFIDVPNPSTGNGKGSNRNSKAPQATSTKSQAMSSRTESSAPSPVQKQKKVRAQPAAMSAPSTSSTAPSTSAGGPRNNNRRRVQRESNTTTTTPTRKRQTFRNSNYGRRTSNQDEEAVVADVQATKDAIRTQLEESFSQLVDNSELGSKEMQQLLQLIAKGVRVLSPYWTDQDLQSNVLSVVLPKLSEELRTKFAARADEMQEKTLYVLKYFLVDEMSGHYAALRAARVNNAGDNTGASGTGSELESTEQSESATDGTGTDASGTDGTVIKKCYYCKTVGHLSFECAELKGMLCFRCFRAGHKARDCGIRCHKCGRMGHIKKNCKTVLVIRNTPVQAV